MNVVCIICSDHMAPADHFFNTPCGHVFHLQCLTQWLERSQSCPQCREKVVQSKIHRIYFNFGTGESTETCSSSLQERVDSLKFQILLKEKDLKYYTSKTANLEKQNAGLRKEVRKVESEINKKNSAIHALKEQTRYFKEQSLECDSLKRQVHRLKSKLEETKHVQLLLDTPIEDANELVGGSRDPATLLTYIAIMKKDLIARITACNKSRVTIKKLDEKLKRKMQLEEKLAIAESKNTALRKRVIELEEVLGITDHSSSLLNVDSAEDPSVLNESTVKCSKTNDDSMEICSAQGNKGRGKKVSTVKNQDVTETSSEASISKRKKESDQMPKHNAEDNDSSVSAIENFEPISAEDSSISISTVDDSSASAKRPKMSIGRKESGDINNLSGNNDSQYENDNKHSRPRRREKASIKREKHNNKSKDGGSSHIIDLT